MSLPAETPESQRLLDNIGRRMLKRRVDALKSLPTFPESILRITQVINEEGTQASFKRIAAVIETDPVLTARILRLVNSAFYGVSGAIATVYDALVMLGLDIVRGLILSTTAMEIVEGRQGVRGLWEHCFGAAIAAVALGRTLGLPRLEELSAAALMHDLGKVVLQSQLGREYDAVVNHAVRQGMTIRAAEEALLGVPHDEIGHWLVSRWRLPPTLAEPIALHHRPEDARAHREAAAAVHVADLMVRAYGFGFPGDRVMPEMSAAAWKTLHLNPHKLQTAVARMHEALQTALVQANLYFDA
ncbi:MAG: HDOD domain-containing protein [Myxococcales bacterium]|nr:HDOD domain-containing protein [Myxococcales bacterium]